MKTVRARTTPEGGRWWDVVTPDGEVVSTWNDPALAAEECRLLNTPLDARATGGATAPPDVGAITERAQYVWATVPLDALGPSGDQLLRRDVPALIAEIHRLRHALGAATDRAEQIRAQAQQNADAVSGLREEVRRLLAGHER